jgi:hypothetical protein
LSIGIERCLESEILPRADGQAQGWSGMKITFSTFAIIALVGCAAPTHTTDKHISETICSKPGHRDECVIHLRKLSADASPESWRIFESDLKDLCSTKEVKCERAEDLKPTVKPPFTVKKAHDGIFYRRLPNGNISYYFISNLP